MFDTGAVFGRSAASVEEGALISPIWMRPSCTASAALAISTHLRRGGGGIGQVARLDEFHNLSFINL